MDRGPIGPFRKGSLVGEGSVNIAVELNLDKFFVAPRELIERPLSSPGSDRGSRERSVRLWERRRVALRYVADFW